MFFKMRNKTRKSEVIAAERARRDPLTSWATILRKRFSYEEQVIFRHELLPLDAIKLPLLNAKEFGVGKDLITLIIDIASRIFGPV